MEKHTTKITSKSIEQSGLPLDFKKAIAEYIWNGFDAKATTIDIKFEANEIGYLHLLSISDNGVGIDLSSIDETFGNFLDSKKSKTLDQNGFVKGKKGKGRYSFDVFFNFFIWETTLLTPELQYLKFDISIKKGNLQDFQISNKIISKVNQTGTIVNFYSFHSLTSDLLSSDEFNDFIASEFGWFLFLNKESNYKISINNIEIDYWNIIGENLEFDEKINEFDFSISFIRWNKNIGDKYFYYFLNEEQKECERKHTLFNNKTVDFHHSLYIISDYFNEFKITRLDQPTLDFDGKNQSDVVYKKLLKKLNEIVNNEEKKFIRDLKANKLIDGYNSKNIFPLFKNNEYEQLRKKDLEIVVKEIYCVQPKIFQGLKIPQSKTIVGFLNLLLDTDQRENVLDILENIIELSEDERCELSKALQKTKISSITNLIKMIENRLNVVTVLKTLVFELSKFTNERDHIQKIIENNYWLFGEQYHIVSADKNFETTLNNYLDFTENGKKNKEKLISKEKLKRPDIFIARKSEIIDSESNDYTIEENIIVELKRPSVVIGKTQYDQIENYIRFIINEPKFNSELRTWKLILVGKKVDEWIKDEYESNKEKGKRFLIKSVRNYEIYAMTWDDLFKIFNNRHRHIINKLDFKDTIIESLENKGLIMENDMPNELTKVILNK